MMGHFQLGRVILVASFMWCLACIASYLLEWFLLSLHKQLWTCHAVLFFVHIPSWYHVFALHQSSDCQYHAWMSSEERILLLFLVDLLDNSKSIKRNEVSKAADKGAPSERRASTVSTPPHPQDDFQDNTCIDTQQSCVYDEHVSPSAASPVLPLTWHCYMWLHVMCDV